MRQLSRDGRLRNPNEKLLVHNEAGPTAPSASDSIPIVKPIPKDESVGPNRGEAGPTEQKTLEVKGSAKSSKDKISKKKEIEWGEEDEYFVGDKSNEVGLGPKKEKVDDKKLKEQKREEEIAKRNQAEERKRKQGEKVAAKAAAKAQKEAEKKLKEREKRARKKAGGAAIAPESEQPPAEDEAAKPEKIEEKIEAPQKNKDRKGNTVRTRVPRHRGPDLLPKAILKCKKATNYRVWVCALLLRYWSVCSC